VRYHAQDAALKMSPVNKRAFFSNHLSMWFAEAEWYFVTLLSTAIESLDELPDDCDALINELLVRHPEKPSQVAIMAFLQSSERVSGWFAYGAVSPKIISFNLERTTFIKKASSQVPRIDTLGELADWLSLTDSQLDWYANMWRYDSKTQKTLNHYQYQLLEKRDGRMRLIEKPKANLKGIQRKIYHEILSSNETHPAAHGFCKNRSCISHASAHVGKQYLLLFDLEECFQSVGWPMVKKFFKRLGYPESVSVHLTALCTHSVRLKPAELKLFTTTQRERLRQRHLPQGAPSSPALANSALHNLDLRLTGLARRLGLDYSRYADDIAMSTNTLRDWRFLEPLIGGICLDEGVTLNYKKTRIKKSHQKQRITGIVVNNKVNVDRKYFDNLKATLINCTRHGLDSQNRTGHPHFRAHLQGRITYVKSLNEQRGLKLEKIYRDIK